MANCSFQIVSDLHLETPKSRPSYGEFEIQPACSYLALLGDIGNVADPRLFEFVERQLQQFDVVFYVLGNHEPYGITYSEARKALKDFEANIEQRSCPETGAKSGKFVFLDRRRYDCPEGVTVLGCTLFSFVRPQQRDSVSRFVSDFTETKDWTVEAHNIAHERDLKWLNSQVSECAYYEPQRSIVVLTHHSPTMTETANDPRHLQDSSEVQSAFATDLSNQVCWTSPQVKLWAFGHTHFNCDFNEPKTGKRIVANQKGYRREEAVTFDGTKVVAVDVCLDRVDTSPKTNIKRGCCIVQ